MQRRAAPVRAVCWRLQHGRRRQRGGPDVQGDVQEGVVGGGDVAAGRADDLGLQHAPEDALHDALRLRRSCTHACSSCQRFCRSKSCVRDGE